MKITKKEVRDLRNKLQASLDKITEQIGFQCSVGSAKFTESHVIFRLECAQLGPDGKPAMNPEVKAFVDNAERMGLKKGDIHRSFFHRDAMFQIIGANLRARKCPILCLKLTDRKRYKFPIEAVKWGLSQPVPEPGKRHQGLIASEIGKIDAEIREIEARTNWPVWKRKAKISELSQQREKLTQELGHNI